MRNKLSALIVCLLIGVGVVGLTGQAYAQTGGGGQTLWKLQGLLISPVQSNWFLSVPTLGGFGTSCLHVDNTGKVTATGTDCGSGGGGGGGSSGWTAIKGAIYNATTTDQVLIDETSTSSNAKLEVNGALNVKGAASSTSFTNSGTSWLIGLTSKLLGTDNTGQIVGTTSVGTNYLTGLLGTINGTALNVGGTITINAASSTALSDRNTFSVLQTLTAATTTNLTASNFWIIGQSAGCAQFDSNAKLTSTGVNCGTGSSGSDPFTHVAVFGQTTSATSTLVSFTGSPFSLVASSTAEFVNASTTNLTVFSNFFLNGEGFTDLTGTGLSNSSGALTVSGLTTTQFASANISQWTNNSNYITLTSLSAVYPISYNSSTGAFSWLGIGTSSAPTVGNLAYWTSDKLLGTAATTSVTCSGTATCSTFNVLGSSPITITGAAFPDPFTHTSVYGQTTSASSTLVALTGSPFSLVASSTVNFVFASTTGLTAFSNFYLPYIGAYQLLETDGNKNVIATTSIGSNLLQTSGVTGGSYTNANITVSDRGIVTSAANGTAGSSGGDPFYHPLSSNSATTTPVLFFGNASSTMFEATSTVWLGNTKNGLISTDVNGKVGLTASSTLFGTGTGGQYLVWANGVPTWTASTTYSGTSPMSLSFSGGVVTSSITNAAADGSTKGASAYTATDFDAASGVISIDYTNGQAASASAKGYLTSADWLTFNGKLNLSNLWNISTTYGTTSLATTTAFWFQGGLNASSTASNPSHIDNFTANNSTTTAATTTNLAVSSVVSALHLGNATGGVIPYAGAAACSANNFVTTLSATGGTTCGTAAISGVNLGSNLFAHTVSGSLTGTSFNGSAAVSDWALNMANANSWTAKQTFVGASSTALTVSQTFYTPFTSGLGAFATDNHLYNISTTSMNASITGSSGSVANAHTVSGSITGTSFNGSAAVSDWTLNMANANTWTAKQTFGAASTTDISASNSFFLPFAGGLVYSDANKKATTIATTSVSCTGNISCTSFYGLNAASTISFTGTLGLSSGGTNASLSGAYQVPFMNSANTALTTNSLFVFDPAEGDMSIGTSTAGYTNLGLLTLGTSTEPQEVWSDNIAGDSQWAVRNAGGNLDFATSTATATSTVSVVHFSLVNYVWQFFSNVLIKISSTAAFVVQDGFGTAVLTVNTASTTGAIFQVQATSTSDTLFQVDQYGHLTASSTRATPTITCTPSGGTVGTNANDTTGEVTTGTLSTACTVTFASVYSATPEIFVTGNNTGATVAVTSKSTSSFTISLSTGLTGDIISYFVVMP